MVTIVILHPSNSERAGQEQCHRRWSENPFTSTEVFSLPLFFGVKAVPATQPLCSPDDRTCFFFAFRHSCVPRRRQGGTVNSHHTSVLTGRADVSATESLPPSCSYTRPQQHPSLSRAASTEGKSLVIGRKPRARWPRGMGMLNATSGLHRH